MEREAKQFSTYDTVELSDQVKAKFNEINRKGLKSYPQKTS